MRTSRVLAFPVGRRKHGLSLCIAIARLRRSWQENAAKARLLPVLLLIARTRLSSIR